VPTVELLTVNTSVTGVVVVIVTVGEARVPVIPVGAVTARFTVPVNPFWGVTVIVTLAFDPTTNETGFGEAVTVKSVTFNETETLRVTVKPENEPVTVIVKVPPEEELTVKRSVWLPVVIVTLGVPRVAVTPAGAETERFTVPVNPFSGATVMVDVPWAPGASGPILAGLAVILKSTTANEPARHWPGVAVQSTTVKPEGSVTTEVVEDATKDTLVLGPATTV
jgi:hypothetical protein